MSFNLQEYILFRTEVDRELFNTEVDNNFKMVANPWVADRVYEEGNIVYHPVQIISETGEEPTGGAEQQLAWWRAKQRTIRGVFDISHWDLIGGIGNIDAIIDTVTAFGRILVNSTDPVVLNSTNNVLLQAQNPNDLLRLRAGDGITLYHNASNNTIQINAPGATGEENVGSNIGIGQNVYAGKTGVTLRFRGFIANNIGSNILTVATVGNDIRYQVNEGAINLQNLNNGSPNINMLSDVNAASPGSGDILQFNSGTGTWNSTSSASVISNIYTNNGNLSTNRTVNLNTNDLNIWDGSAAHTGGGTISLGYIKIPEGNTPLNAAGGSPGNGNNLDIIGASNQASIRFFNAPAAHPSGEVVRLGLRKIGTDSQFDILSRGSVVIKTGNAYDGGGISNIILDSHCSGTAATRLPGMTNHTGGLTIATGALCVGTAFSSAGVDNYMRQDGVRGLNISFEQDNGTGIATADRWNNSTGGWEFGHTPILFYNRLGGAGGSSQNQGSFTFAIGDSANRTNTGAGKREQSDIVLQLSRAKDDDTIDGQLRLPKYGQGNKLDSAPEYILGVTAEGRVKEVGKETINGFPITISDNGLSTANTYEFSNFDSGKIIKLDSTSTINLEIPDSTISSTIPIGTRVEYWASDTGDVVISGGSGVTLLSRGNRFTSAGKDAIFYITKVDTDTYIVSGDVVA